MLLCATTEDRLNVARDINELYVGSPLEERLYSVLRELGVHPEREFPVPCRRPEVKNRRPLTYFLDLALFCRDRNLDVECDGDTWHVSPELARADRVRDNLLEAQGWHILRFNTGEIHDEMDTVLTRISSAVNRYGGLDEETGAVRRFGPDGRLRPGQPSLDLFE
jgi:hypothetical protein